MCDRGVRIAMLHNKRSRFDLDFKQLFPGGANTSTAKQREYVSFVGLYMIRFRKEFACLPPPMGQFAMSD